jgi:hypothetical protein
MRQLTSGDIKLSFSTGGKNYVFNYKSNGDFLTPEWQ